MATSPTATTWRRQRIVVGADGSAEAREALRWTARLAGPWHAEVVVVHAVGLLEALDGRLVAAHHEQARIERVVADQWCTPLRGTGCSHRVVVRDGVPADVLRQVAVAEAADLVVVGSRGIGATPGLALGSTSLHLLQLAPCPVLVVTAPRDATRDITMREIVLAVDSATPTTRAADLISDLAALDDVRVTIVHAVEEVPVFPLGPETTISSQGETDAPERDRARLTPLTRRLDQHGIRSELRVERGPAPDVVVATATALDADLVVVGSAHPSHSPDPLYDSTSRQIVARIGRPTLVVPETWTRAPPPAPTPRKKPTMRSNDVAAEALQASPTSAPAGSDSTTSSAPGPATASAASSRRADERRHR